MRTTIISFLLLLSTVHAQTEFRFFINNINLPINNRGILADVSIPPGYAGGKYNDIIFLFSGGFWLSGYNGDTLWANAQSTASLVENYIPGNVDSNSNDPLYKIYVVNQSDPPFGSSWLEWQTAVDIGAEFYDGNSDGIYNPIDLNGNNEWDLNEDRPDLIGDQVAWCVFNDGELNRTRFQGVPPLGIEIHQTVFGYTPVNAPQLQNVLFIRYKIFNTGKVNNVLDSCYFSAWSDPDLGDYTDDQVGCDTLLNSGFDYNDEPDNLFGAQPPSFFNNLLQGPYSYIPGETFIDINSNGIYDEGVDTPLDTAYNHLGPIIGKQQFPGAKNSDMTAFTHFLSSHPSLGDPNTEFDARNYMLGRQKSGELIDPCNWGYGEVRGGVDCNSVNPLFWYSGDPETNFGWINTTQTDQRMLIHTGPFSLEEDKPITIIAAYTIGQGNSPLNSVTAGKELSQYVRGFYQSNFGDGILNIGHEKDNLVNDFRLFQNFPNPFNPVTSIQYSIGVQQLVSVKVFDVLGNEIATLINEEKSTGNYYVEFNGAGLSSGIYFYQLKSGSFVETKKMVLLK